MRSIKEMYWLLMRVLESEIGVKILSEERNRVQCKNDDTVSQICYIHMSEF